METVPLWLPIAFFAVATVYATVGFGGGSSYLALLVIAGVDYRAVPQMALVCNLLVSAGGVWHYYRAGHFDFKRILPFVVLAVPMAFIGGRLPVSERVFFVLLGLSLLVAGARMFIPTDRIRQRRMISMRQAIAVGLPVGAALGFLAGTVGIGGGVFLSPLLILSGWCDAKKAAAAASLFIVLNSAAGLAGQMGKGVYVDAALLLPLAAVVVLGGQIGSLMGAYRLSVGRVRQALAVLILFVAARVLWELF